MEQPKSRRTTTKAEKTTPVTAKVDQPSAPQPEKKKKKYSGGLKSFQKTERRAAKSAKRVSDAVSKGVNAYLKKQDKSARKKRDGAIADVTLNVAKGISVAVEKGSPAIYDVAKAIDFIGMPKKQRKRLRKQIGRTMKSFKVPFLR